MALKKIKPIGMRSFKTGIAVIISTGLARTPLIANPFYAAIGTIFGMQNTVSNSMHLGIGRIWGTLIGATIGFVFAALGLIHPIFVGMAVILVISAARLFKLNHSIVIMFTLCVSIMLNPREQSLIIYTIVRTIDTALGVFIGVIVNFLIAPPNYLNELHAEIVKLNELISETVENKEKLPALYEEINAVKVAHSKYIADQKYDKQKISNVKLQEAIKSCEFLFFHFDALNADDEAVHQYHFNKIKKAQYALKYIEQELVV